MWFEQLRYWFIGESLDHAIEYTLIEYAGIIGDSPKSTQPTPSSSSSSQTASVSTPTDDLTRGFAMFTVKPVPEPGSGRQTAQRVLNIEKRDKYRAAEAKIMFVLNKCIDDFDQEHIKPHTTAKARWESLWAKYSKITAAAKREDLQQITGFKFGYKDGKSVDMTISSAWAQLVSVRGKIAAADTKLAETFDLETLFQYLLAGLPDSFKTLKQSLDANTSSDVYDKLDILERNEKEYDLSAKAKSANVADTGKGKPNSQNHRYKRRHSDKVQCFFCGEEHLRSKCELRELLTAMVSEFQINKAREAKHDKRKNKSSTSKPKSSGKRASAKGYTADDRLGQEECDRSENTSSSSDSDQSVETEEDEECHLSKEKTQNCKIPESDWCSDSGCTAHMTDKPDLFRGPMIPIKRRTVKVGGGRLYADFKGRVEMRVAGVSLILEDVLYVPGLGINLLSSRKLCSEWKCLGVFNSDSMWFISENKQVILQANVKEGLYIVSRIIPGKLGLETAMISMLQDIGQAENSQDSEPCCHRALTADEEDDVHIHDDGEHGLRKLSRTENLARYRLMHRRFAHLGPDKLRNLHKVTTLKRPVLVPTDREMCRVCKLTKLRNRTNKVLSPWKEAILALVSIDVAGPFLPTIRGNKYFAQVVDNATRKTWSLVDKTKSGLMIQLRKWKATEERRTRQSLCAVRSDNAAEIRELLDEWSKDGVREEPTTTYTGSHQNGVAERSIQQAETDARAMLKDADLPLEFWDYAVQYDTYVRSRSPSGPLIDGVRISPEEAYTGERPSIDHIRVFGSVAYSYVSPKSLPTGTTSKKLIDSGVECVFLGFSNETTKQYCVYRPDLGYAVMSSVVDVDEEKQGGSLDLKIRGLNAQGNSASMFVSGTQSHLLPRKPVGRPKKEETIPIVELLPARLNNFDIVIPVPQKHEDDATSRARLRKSDTWDTPDNSPSRARLNKTKDEGLPETDISDDSSSRASLNKRKGGVIPKTDDVNAVNESPEEEMPDAPQPELDNNEPSPAKRKEYDDENERAVKRLKALLARTEAEVYALVCQRIYELEEETEEAAFIAAGGKVDITIPMSYDEAISDPTHGTEWADAIQVEIDGLNTNKTWKEEKAPHGANLVSTKWVFTIKTNPDGSLERYKARLVARGFSQVHGEDYTETFAPTVRTDTLRVFLAMVAANDLECRQYDVKNAFTESSLKERIYLAPPKGVSVTPGLSLRVLRSLYGLKQSARDWNILCKNELKKLGFAQSLADPCLFTHAQRGITLLVYVDDIAAAAKDNADLVWFFDNFRQRFNTKDLGEISKILGMRITRNRRTRELFIDQEEYLEKILPRLGLPVESSSTVKPRPTPVSGKYEKLEPARENEERADKTQYQKAIGSIMYAMVYSRPDIAFHIGQLSQQLRDPAKKHESAVKEIGRYLRFTIKQKIRFGPSGNKLGPTKEACLKIYDPDMLALYSDADWANMKDRKSISGHVAMLFNGPVAYGSKKQRAVSTSSCESEYIGMSTCCKQGQWIAQVLRDMGFPEYVGTDPRTVEMRADNQGAIALVKNAHLHERSKHIDISYHHIRDLEERKKIKITYVPTTDMVADGFTKPLERVAFEKFKSMLGLVDDSAKYWKQRCSGS
jgi:hypothetical protein